MENVFISPEERGAFLTQDNALQLNALKNLIERRQGKFALALVQYDLPRWQQILASELQTMLPQIKLSTLQLQGWIAQNMSATVLDELRELDREVVESGATPDALLIFGFERYLREEQVESGNTGATLDETELQRAIQPLNLGRNELASFPCPVVLCLPETEMGILLQYAPDLNTIRSGSFTFCSDLSCLNALWDSPPKSWDCSPEQQEMQPLIGL